MNGLQKIISTDQIKGADLHTISSHKIRSIDLMEKAASAFVQYLMTLQIANHKIIVFCGSGNNGGDGLAICRMLIENGFDAHAYFIDTNKTPTNDCSANLKTLHEVKVIENESEIPEFNHTDIIIDALFGIGIRGKVEGLISDVIRAINSSANTVVYSVDMPSGLPSETIAQSEDVVKADLVITFQRPKASFFFPEHKTFVKDWIAIDIGLDEDYIQQSDSKTFYINHEVQQYVKRRAKFSHKGHYGHALLMAGSFDKMGAALLSAHACLKSGVGLLTTHVPKCGVNIMQSSLPEAMCMSDDSEEYLTQLPNISVCNVLAIGPGIGTATETETMFFQLLKNVKVPMVIDADAINILSKNPGWMPHIPQGSILTPHIKEFDRLVGTSSQTTDRLIKAAEFTEKHHCVIVLKDACTWVIDDKGHKYVHDGGNPGMATAGSGDVLTGIITGLLAQGNSSVKAACIAVYHHGLAGDKAAKTTGQMGLMASDITKHLKID